MLAEMKGTLRDRIEADYRKLLAGLTHGRDVAAFPPDENGPYGSLPSYHDLTGIRGAIATWIEQLRSAPTISDREGDWP
jgi:hypothetical protein